MGEGGGFLEKSRSQWQEKRRCFNCGKVGHLAKDCHQGKADKQPEGTTLAMLNSTANHLGYDSTTDKLVVDTGASHHMCCDRDMFVYMHEPSTSVVKCGGGEIHHVKEQGTVCIQSPKGIVRSMMALQPP